MENDLCAILISVILPIAKAIHRFTKVTNNVSILGENVAGAKLKVLKAHDHHGYRVSAPDLMVPRIFQWPLQQRFCNAIKMTEKLILNK